MYRILLIVLVLAPIFSLAQEGISKNLNKTDTVYVDEKANIVTGIDVAKYIYVRRLLSDGRLAIDVYNHLWRLMYKAAQVRSAEKIDDGVFKHYDSLGNVTREGILLKGRQVGVWKEYYPSSNAVRVIENYQDGKLHGEFKNFYENGKLKREANYADSKLITGKKYDIKGNEIRYTPYSVMPTASYNVNAFLGSTIRYPRKARKLNIEGRVAVQFVVDKKGSISHPIITQSVHPILDEEAIRLISLMRPWKPGMLDDEFVDVYYTLPITFRLED